MWCSGFSKIFYSILYRELLHFFFLNLNADVDVIASLDVIHSSDAIVALTA